MSSFLVKTGLALLCLPVIGQLCFGFSDRDNKKLSAPAAAYIAEVLNLLEERSVYKNHINWQPFKEDVFLFAANSHTIQECYPAIKYAIAQLGDNHTYFSSKSDQEGEPETKPLPEPKDEAVPQDIAYIRIPFCIGDETRTAQYIQSIAAKITAQNKKNVKGWIVDLNNNFGGNMWPMMAALGALLEPGIQGYFTDADNVLSEWRYEKGKVYLNDTLLAENPDHTAVLKKNKIAVLINNQTASSGEAIAVLFKGYPQSRFFGTPTFGVSTGCESFTLSDGSRINLATSIFMDKNKNKYGGKILPDMNASDQEALQQAIAWIYN